MNAALEITKTQPKKTVVAVVKQSAFKGRPRRWSTRENNLDAGRPPSLANAYTIRLLVVMMLIVPKSYNTC